MDTIFPSSKGYGFASPKGNGHLHIDGHSYFGRGSGYGLGLVYRYSVGHGNRSHFHDPTQPVYGIEETVVPLPFSA